MNCVYETPGLDIDLFCESIEQFVYAFVCGDFNVDLLKHDTHSGTKPFLDCMYGLGLHPLMDRPSRITTNSCTLIDNIFANQTNYFVRTGLLINDISDHLPTLTFCNYEIDKQKCDTFKYARNVKDDKVFLLIESLRQEKCDNVLQTDDIILACTNFVSRFSTLYNHHCPVEKVMIKQTCKKNLVYKRNG